MKNEKKILFKILIFENYREYWFETISNGFSKSMSIEVSQHDPDTIRLRDREK